MRMAGRQPKWSESIGASSTNINYWVKPIIQRKFEHGKILRKIKIVSAYISESQEFLRHVLEINGRAFEQDVN